MNSSNSELTVVGYGACTPLGTRWDETRDRLYEGEVGYEPETLNDRRTCFGRVDGLETDDSSPRFHRLAQRAIEDLTRGLSIPESAPLGLVATTSKGELGTPDPSSVTGPGNPGVWSGRIAEQFPQNEFVSTPNTACATGLSALIQAGRWIEDELVDHALVVTSESCFHPLLLAGYQNLKVLCDETGMRPFHEERSGFALAEGAAALYLTRESFRTQHDLPATGRLYGWAETCDAHHMTKMKADGNPVFEALETSLVRSGYTKNDVDLLHAHLTTTETNDSIESELLERWDNHPVLQAIKPSLGHTIGGAGLLEVIATLCALRRNRPFPLPTTERRNLPVPDHFPDGEPSSPLRVGISWNMGFGGHNAAAALGTVSDE